MKVRKVRLEDAYLHGSLGFSDYLSGRLDSENEDNFYRVFINSYDKISEDGIPIEEIMFYVVGFFDEYEKEESRREREGEESLKLEEEAWVIALMEKLNVNDLDFLGAAIVDDLMGQLEKIYRRPGKMEKFIKDRLKIQSSYVIRKYDEYLEKDWIKIEVKDRGRN